MEAFLTPQIVVPRVAAERAFGAKPVAQPAPPATALAAGPEQDGSAGAGGFGSRCLIGGLTAALAVRAMRRRSRSQWRIARPGAAGEMTTLVYTPKQTYEALVEKGEANSKMSVMQILYAAIMGGCYVGLSGLLSLAISGNMGTLSHNMSAQKFVFAALFPINLLLVLQSGGQLFTGNTATMTCGFWEGKVNLRRLLKSWTVSWIGNVMGCGLIALIANYTHLLTAGTAELAVATVLKKCGSSFWVTFVKAIMCNWLVCMAVFLSTQAQDMTGKMVGIWFPISMFVAIGFEHSVANMFLLPAGLFSGVDLTVLDVLRKNLIPVSLGNAFAGAIVIGTGFAFSQGSLGKGDRSSFSGWLRILTGRSKKEEAEE